ncbi:MAG: thermosome subunit beta [Candidatus Bathyarchaeia archaeon]
MSEAIPAMVGNQPVLILKEGSTRSRGKEAQASNIMAAKVVAEVVKSSLGPKGMDKMLVDSLGDVTITNDGATILDEMEIQHPAAKMMVEVSKTTDKEVGDGTTSAVVLAGEFLKKAEELLEKNVHPTIIVDGYRKSIDKALEVLAKIAIKATSTDKSILRKVAITSMASKAVSEEKEYLADLVVDVVLKVSEKLDAGYKVDIDAIKVEKKAGGSVTETRLIDGIAFDKEVVHPDMPKRVENAKIALIESPLEIEKTEFDAKINIESPDQMKAFLDEEARMLKDMVDKLVKAKVNVAVCQKGIDDLSQHYLAKAGILGIRRVKESDMDKAAKATGAKIVTNLDDLTSSDLGTAKIVEERKIGEDKWTFVEGCKNARSLTLLIRGGTEKVVDEADRSIHDALMVVRDVVQQPKIVAGGGGPEVELASQLRRWSEQLSGREQLAAQGFAEAMEIIPSTLAENAGMEPIDVIAELRSKHEKGGSWAGVDVLDGKVKDMAKIDVYEPLAVKEQIIKSSGEAACMILRIDDVVAAGKMKGGGGPPGGPGGEGMGGMGGEDGGLD